MILLIWIIKLIEITTDTSFIEYGLYPKSVKNLYGILTSPFIHSDLSHIASNTLSLWVSLFFIIYAYRKIALYVLIITYLLTGLAVWLFGRESYHVGASGLIYSYLAFLFFMGVFRRETQSIAVALIITFLYGGLIWGVLPADPTISYESHLAGVLVGLLCAILFFKYKSDEVVIEYESDEDYYL